MFSTRLPASLASTPLAVQMAEQRRTGRIRADLTLSNPTDAGFSYSETLATAWANAATLHYTPASLGLGAAREAVASLYRQAGESLHVDQVALTASTSEAYGFLFKLLCSPGDRILAPAPSYPLLDHLAALEGVHLDHYRLHDAGHWMLDMDALAASVTPTTRAIVVVAPHNPTGAVPDAGEWRALVEVCARHDLALLVDEVFAPYRFDGPVPPVDVALSDPPALVCRLNGLSKLVGLPQAKLGWVCMTGPSPLVREALARLEIIADTYLSVSTPVQVALPVLLEAGAAVRAQITQRLSRNLGALSEAVAGARTLTLRRPQGGWTAVVRMPVPDEPDEMVRALLADGVLTHPAYFYDFAHDGYLVVSLLPPAAVFDLGVEAVVSRHAHPS